MEDSLQARVVQKRNLHVDADSVDSIDDDEPVEFETQMLLDEILRVQSYVRDYQTDNDSKDSDFDFNIPPKPLPPPPPQKSGPDDLVSQRINIFSKTNVAPDTPSAQETVSTVASTTPLSQQLQTPNTRRRKRIDQWTIDSNKNYSSTVDGNDDDDTKSRRSFDGLLRSVHSSDDDDDNLPFVSPSHSTRSMESNPYPVPCQDSDHHGARQGRRNKRSSWNHSWEVGESAPDAAPTTPVSIPVSISYSGAMDDSQDDGELALKDAGEGSVLLPSRPRRTTSNTASTPSISPKSRDPSTTSRSLRSFRSLNSASFGSFDTLMDSDLDCSDDDMDASGVAKEVLIIRIAKLKDREKKLRAKAKERMHQLQATHTEERDEWKARLVELERIKRERDRLMQDQAEERAMLNESKEATKRQLEDLSKIQRDLDLNSTCKSSGGTDTAKAALDLQSKMESLLQDNRRLRTENEQLLASSKDHVKRSMFSESNSDPDVSIPKNILRYLQMMAEEHMHLSQQISNVADSPDDENQGKYRPKFENQRRECQEAIRIAFQSSQLSTAINDSMSELDRLCEHHYEMLQHLQMERQRRRERTHQSDALKDDKAATIVDLCLRVKRKDEQIQGLEITVEELRAERKEMQMACSQDCNESTETKSAFDKLSSLLTETECRLSKVEEEKLQIHKKMMEQEEEIITLKATEEEKNVSSSKELDVIRKILKRRKEEAKTLKEELRLLRDAIEKQESSDQKIGEFKQLVSQTKERLAALQDQYDRDIRQHQDEQIALQEEIKELKSKQIVEKGEEANAIQVEDMLREKTCRINALEQEVEDLNELHAQQSDDIRAADIRIKDLECMLLEKEATCCEVQTALGQMHLVHEAKCGEMEKLQECCDNLEATLKDTNRRMEGERATMAKRSFEDLEQAMSSMGELQEELNAIRSNHNSLQEEVAIVSSQRLDLDEQNIQLKVKVAQLERELSSAKETAKESESGKLKKENEILQRALEKVVAEYQGELTRLETNNTNLKQRNEKQKKEIESLEDEILKRSLKAAEQAAAVTVEGLDAANEAKHEQDWANLSECVDDLNASFSVQESEQAPSINSLEDRFRALQTSTQQRGANLLETIRRQKVSIDSMFEDLIFAQDQVKKSRKDFSELQQSLQYDVEDTGSRNLERFLKLDDTLSEENGTTTIGEPKQGDMLQSIVEKQYEPKKQRSSMGLQRFFGAGNKRSISIGDDSPLAHSVQFALEDKCQKLEEENMTLKSNLVQLQTQYKEEAYKYKKDVEELQLSNDAFQLKNLALSEAVAGEVTKPQDDRGIGAALSVDISTDPDSTGDSVRDAAKIVKV